eukprot:768560-Hanusia_phi.AAC.6
MHAPVQRAVRLRCWEERKLSRKSTRQDRQSQEGEGEEKEEEEEVVVVDDDTAVVKRRKSKGCCTRWDGWKEDSMTSVAPLIPRPLRKRAEVAAHAPIATTATSPTPTPPQLSPCSLRRSERPAGGRPGAGDVGRALLGKCCPPPGGILSTAGSQAACWRIGGLLLALTGPDTGGGGEVLESCSLLPCPLVAEVALVVRFLAGTVPDQRRQAVVLAHEAAS